MRIHAHLNVIDGRVICPHTCQWKSADQCTACAELVEIEHHGSNATVVCDPQVQQPLASVVGSMMRP